MTETFTVKQEIKFSEFLNVIFFQASKMKLIRRLFLISFVVSFASVVLDLVTTSEQTRNWYQLIFSFLVYPVFLFLFLSVAMILAAILLIILRPNHFKNVTYLFTHWGMEKTGKGIEFSRPWRKFLKVRESRHFIFLYISENDAHVIQKRMFSSKEEIEEFKQLIFRH